MTVPCKLASGALCHGKPNIKDTSPKHTKKKNFKIVHQLCPLPSFYFGSTICLIQIASFCLTDQRKVSQAIGTCRMQSAFLLVSYLTSYSHLLPVSLYNITTVPRLCFCLSSRLCWESGPPPHTHRHTCTRLYTPTGTGT